jgi:hypothetical protein
MRVLKPFHAICAAAGIVVLAACSSGSAIAPRLASPTAHERTFNNQTSHDLASFYSCPVSGTFEYVSDEISSAIYVFAGKFAGQSPCGIITSGVVNPEGLFVLPSTHDLYVANAGAFNVIVFHRGGTTPYNTYTDPGPAQYTFDVTVAADGTVLATNNYSPGSAEKGSISTWIGGPHGGTFVGNYPMTNDPFGYWITVKQNGTVYYNDVERNSTVGFLWKLRCPTGVCGTQTKLAGVSFNSPGGMTHDNMDDLLVTDAQPGSADTFELPNPTPSTFPLAGVPLGMALSKSNRHWFVADYNNNDASEYLYPSGALVGTVHGITGGAMWGVAIDP